jgi:hypothetical protein
VSRVPGRAISWTALCVLAGAVAGGAALGTAMASAQPRESPRPLPPATVATLPPTSTPSTVPTVPIGPPDPPPPGPITVNAAAWRGHGDLAFVSSGQLDILSTAGTRTAVAGPAGPGYDSNPAWSPNGAWLAFLHTGPADGYDVPPPTLWLLRTGAAVAHEVTTSGIGMFAWSPRSTLAFTEFSGTYTPQAVTENIWFDRPGSIPTAVAVGTGMGVGTIAWSPNGAELAFDDSVAARAATPSAPGAQPMGRLGTVSMVQGRVTTTYQQVETGIVLAGWWPDGGGLLFWEDPGFAEMADGELLYSLAGGSSHTVELTSSLVGSTWWAPDGAENIVAVVQGSGRSIWSAGREVELCRFPAATCQAVTTPTGSESLAPSWTAAGGVIMAVASTSGPFGPSGQAFWSAGWMAQWNSTNWLGASALGGPPVPVTAAPAGALLASPAARGDSMVMVANDALWLATAAGIPAVRVAGPLYSTVGPNGYYGEVDWAGTFAWSAATGPRQGSTDLLGEGLAAAGSVTP